MRPLAIDLPYSTDPDKPTRIIPLSCAHFPQGDRDLLLKWRDEVAKPNTYTILIGDQFDTARTHFRRHVRAYQEDSNSQNPLDDFVRKDVADLAKILAPIKSKIMGVLWGNHRWEFANGITSDQLLCETLGVPFLGVFAFLRLRFKSANVRRSGNNQHILKLIAHHTGGCGAVRTRGGDLIGVEKLHSGFDADIYVSGHTHRAMSDMVDVLTLSDFGTPVPRTRTKVFIRAGSLAKGYDLDDPSAKRHYSPRYAETAAYSPSDLGWVELSIWFKRHHSRGDDHVQAMYRISRSTH